MVGIPSPAKNKGQCGLNRNPKIVVIGAGSSEFGLDSLAGIFFDETIAANIDFLPHFVND